MGKLVRGANKRGRPKTTGAGTQIGMRWQRTELAAIDTWRHGQDGSPSRTEAIRRLVELGLGVASRSAPGIAMVPLVAHPKPGRRGKRAAEAAEMASKQIDKLANPLVPEEEQRARKRRLIKGHANFARCAAILRRRRAEDSRSLCRAGPMPQNRYRG